MAAGEALQSSDAAVKGRPAAEVCYSRATGCATALLPALADGIDAHARDSFGLGMGARATALDDGRRGAGRDSREQKEEEDPRADRIRRRIFGFDRAASSRRG